ncbi:3-hydroxy-3-methylglutaryl coenzyme A reductase [Halolactibacillus miurensis]|uniref:3-hydroxy-3-methylglutaryl coenzyme A reductase n=2 Tax=Halolactibacillus miurensis TaxID=306541 RepID=A0A1I6SZV6_9BACI|nr:3-hydroxy-3-methylglutaryl coenzyme A reductase [Halolactibacillus miurensis]SFS82432.1 hydroxymethylglutaryl-CoA reductase [Halolactibacillus miurensis]
MTSPLDKFYKKSINERIESLMSAGFIEHEHISNFKQSFSLPEGVSNHMVENVVGTYQLPLGLGMNFLINSKDYLVPMATEEPSVIAAASFGAKTVRAGGGFTTTQEKRWMIGQVILKNVEDPEAMKEKVLAHYDDLVERAHAAHPSIVKRGGGVKDIDVRIIESNPEEHTPEFFVVHLYVDTKEAMGANIVNTMAEAIKDALEIITGGTALMGILSNYATEALVTASFRLDPSLLSRSGLEGTEVRDRIVEASQIASVDPYRAVTHNKGIMNGVEAAVLATGNDTRATSAGIHAYASQSGQYRSLSKYYVDEHGYLVGTLTIPLAIGTVGGSISIHPGAQFTQHILGDPDAKTLAGIVCAVGLAQNFSALRALVTDGIQRGHMALQAKSLAMTAGAVGVEIDVISRKLRRSQPMNLTQAEALLEEYRNQS